MLAEPPFGWGVPDWNGGVVVESPEAEQCLERLRRQRLAERLLFDIVGVEWARVHRVAIDWAEAIVPEVAARLVELLGDPATCPHGNPIPGSSREQGAAPLTRLVAALPGRVTVARIDEELEEDDQALALLASARMIPGCVASVLGSTDAGVSLRTGTGEWLVPVGVAGLTWVRPA